MSEAGFTLGQSLGGKREGTKCDAAPWLPKESGRLETRGVLFCF